MFMIHVDPGITADCRSWMLLRTSQCIMCEFRKDVQSILFLELFPFPNQRYAIVMHGILRDIQKYSPLLSIISIPQSEVSQLWFPPLCCDSSPLLRFLPSAPPLKYSFVRPPTTTNPPFPPPLETLLNRAAAIQKLSEVGVGVGGEPDERGPWTLVHFRNLIRNTTTYA